MSYSYSGDPSDTPKDSVRFLIGDTDEEMWFLTDQEINWIIQTWESKGHVYFYASKAADAIAGKVTKEVSISSDGQTHSLSELQNRFTQLAIDLMNQYRELLASGVSVSAGGFLAGERRDPNTSPFAFGTQMHDNPRAGGQDYGDTDYPENWDGSYGVRVP